MKPVMYKPRIYYAFLIVIILLVEEVVCVIQLKELAMNNE